MDGGKLQMIFQRTFEKVLLKQKSQTRRIVKDSDILSWTEQKNGYCIALPFDKPIVVRNSRYLYQVGKTYAVQPSRGKETVGRIRVTAIRREDVRNISLADIQAEGFDSYASFMYTWILMHDKAIVPMLGEARYNLMLNDLVKDRPTHLYDAWVLEFEVVE